MRRYFLEKTSAVIQSTFAYRNAYRELESKYRRARSDSMHVSSDETTVLFIRCSDVRLTGVKFHLIALSMFV